MNFKTNIIIFFLVLVFGLFVYMTARNQPEPVAETAGEDEQTLYRVVWVVDGDTIRIERDGKNELVRLLGIDSPEVGGPYTKEECFGPEASAYTLGLLRGKYVYLKTDKYTEDRDQYGRLLRYVYFEDGTSIEKEILVNGYGKIYINALFEMKEEYAALESEAREVGLGLWGECGEQVF